MTDIEHLTPTDGDTTGVETTPRPGRPGKSAMAGRLAPKDLIAVGVFAVIYVVLVYAFAMLGYFPAFMPLLGVVIGLMCQTPVLLLAIRVRRFGALTILGVLIGMLMGMTTWPTLITATACGLAADLLGQAGRYRSKGLLIAALGVFNMWVYGQYSQFFFNRDSYLSMIAQGYGQEYVDQISGLFPMWLAWAMPVVLFVSGAAGAWIASKLLSRHFERAGLA